MSSILKVLREKKRFDLQCFVEKFFGFVFLFEIDVDQRFFENSIRSQ